jgi:hypothetical protein
MPPSVPAAIPTKQRLPPVLFAPLRRVTPGALWQAVAVSVSALACLATDAAVMALLAGTYKAKRRLDIDVFPGRDMLPDLKVEAAIRAVVGLVRWYL